MIKTDSMTKQDLRLHLRSMLHKLDPELISLKSKAICKAIMDSQEFKSAGAVMLYLPLPHEVDVSSLILHCWQDGKTVVVPQVSWQQRHMIPVEIHSLNTGFETHSSGLKNPTTGSPVSNNEIDMVITPGLGFDMSGHRLGRGGAYYDRFFSHKDLKAVKFGVAFQEQILSNVPNEEHDQKIDCLVTDEVMEYFTD